ncbi:hypothetical protein [Lysobacter capsici]|uniref:hypothetical protein n=1 Tax=Lysobacter capsici TaxID=435897 RepID=UPI000699B498|nr:hypothetical protein [Lysobacter capsici]
MSGLWSAQQREWLQAMGHTVMALAGSEPPVEAPMANAAPIDAARNAEPPARAPQPMRERTASESAAPEPAQAAPRAAARGDDTPPLLRNLLRAARRAAGDAQVLALFDAAALRGNPAAKRALWPQLRTLRRTGQRG